MPKCMKWILGIIIIIIIIIINTFTDVDTGHLKVI
jgi:hypothetical protein